MKNPNERGPTPAESIATATATATAGASRPGPGPGLWRRLWLQEDLNFLLTNRIPRIAATRLMGWYAGLRSPTLTRLSIAVWRLFTDLDLSEARETRFESVQACFTRALRDGARPIDPDPRVLCSPCDAIVGACGPVRGTEVFQAKGFPYALGELFGPTQDTRPFHDGQFVTLRLTSAMYHRFHAPHDVTLEHVSHLVGDTWNVNPIALARVQRLFCRNERAVLQLRLAEGGHPLALVPVAAILVASLRLHAVDLLLHRRHPGPHEIACRHALRKGEELGWFQHGSTIIVFAPPGFRLAEGIAAGRRLRMGEPLMTLPDVDGAPVAAG
ncbi:archaetidylserine decarboxylase [Piscinibacter sakaiensis]|uniref:phosphatidylserine decarboxylase n=1 Tax=Piscinibacter sakaiensis TaxID=1547922 RepID=A0A0K8P1J0_PISS1|nr:archaetidylserine decarboxylase [Piscinibacter sakaiensis]GAP36404.1 phosphatidylserine decarboxylase [Piscinibacter sakaiensis]